MSHTIIDQAEFKALTGVELENEQANRFDTVAAIAIAELEALLGWPLLPDSWDNQYIEIGKSRSEGFCPDADSEDLDAPDEVEGKNRLFTFNVGDEYLHIDPATTIHSIKFVRNGVTCKTYEDKEFVLKRDNGNPQTIRYIGIRKFLCISGCVRIREPRQFAVDADWAYPIVEIEDKEVSTIPTDLKKVLADMIAYQMDDKRDVKSESVVSHSYSKYDRGTPLQIHEKTIQKYAGPNGTATRRLV